MKQEIWAFLITHYAAQVFISEAADELGADADRYSFTTTINIIRRQVLNQAAFSPSRLDAAHQEMIRDIQDQPLPKRRYRSCPRRVRRITIRNTNIKRTHHKIITYDGPPEIFVFNRPAA